MINSCACTLLLGPITSDKTPKGSLALASSPTTDLRGRSSVVSRYAGSGQSARGQGRPLVPGRDKGPGRDHALDLGLRLVERVTKIELAPSAWESY
jgi:hypothetical protein